MKGTVDTMPMTTKKIRSALPIYVAAITWAACALIFPLYKLGWLIITALLSLAGFLIARLLCNDRSVSVHEPGKTAETGDKALNETLAAAGRQLDQLEIDNIRIPDPQLTAHIDRMETAGRKILEEIARRPEKAPRIRRFLSYYLPTSVKLLDSYIHMTSEGAGGSHSAEVERNVEENAGLIATAFEAQLDALYADEALDITTDIEVLEKMIRSDGLDRRAVAESNADNTKH